MVNNNLYIFIRVFRLIIVKNLLLLLNSCFLIFYDDILFMNSTRVFCIPLNSFPYSSRISICNKENMRFKEIKNRTIFYAIEKLKYLLIHYIFLVNGTQLKRRNPYLPTRQCVKKITHKSLCYLFRSFLKREIEYL